MKVMIVKPTLCCKNSSGLGKVIEVQPLNEVSGQLIETYCVHCHTESRMYDSALFEKTSTGYLIPKTRVIPLPDLDEDVQQTSKEKELLQ